MAIGKKSPNGLNERFKRVSDVNLASSGGIVDIWLNDTSKNRRPVGKNGVRLGVHKPRKNWNYVLDIPPRGGGTLYNSLHARLSFSIPARQPFFFRQRSKSCWQSYTPWSLSTEAGMCRSLFSLMYMSVSGNWEKVSGTVSMRLLLMYSISSCGINLHGIYVSQKESATNIFHFSKDEGWLGVGFTLSQPRAFLVCWTRCWGLWDWWERSWRLCSSSCCTIHSRQQGKEAWRCCHLFCPTCI